MFLIEMLGWSETPLTGGVLRLIDEATSVITELISLVEKKDFCEHWPLAVHLWEKSVAVGSELTDFTMGDIEDLVYSVNNLDSEGNYTCLTQYSR